MGAMTSPQHNPWRALWALVLGFFMILVDSTIVSVATPALKAELDATYVQVIWVTSAYLLAYAIPLLVTGRLGDRFGPKNIYLGGLALFTASSLWCGLTDSIEMLIVARVLQGLGASMMTPQTMSVVTRTFAPRERGKAMALWGATAGVAMLVGPVLGGIIVQPAGWQWIFLVNIPVGIVAFVLAVAWVPTLPTHSHSFDWFGVVLSMLGISFLTFGIQEGETYDWGTIAGWVSVPLLLASGIALMAAFTWWQAKNVREPLLPLSLFKDRNFSVSSAGVATLSFTSIAFPFPFMLWAQSAMGWTPTQAGLVMSPMAVVAVVMSRPVGQMIDRGDPKPLAIYGSLLSAGATALMIWAMRVEAGYLPCLALFLLFVLGNALLWSPLATNATFNLPMNLAGAGSGVYNSMRQMGAVIGSAAISAAITMAVARNMSSTGMAGTQGSNVVLPPEQVRSFSIAMSESLYLVLAAYVVGFVIITMMAPRAALEPQATATRT